MEGKERLRLRVCMLKDNTETRDNTKLSGAAPQMLDKVSNPKGVILLP